MATQTREERPPAAAEAAPTAAQEQRTARSDDWTAVAIAVSVILASIVLALSIASYDRDPGQSVPAAPPGAVTAR